MAEGLLDTAASPVALSVQGLVKTYKGAASPAVDGLDLTVAPGEIFGLLGPNGAGKTTAISIMSTLLAPTAGSVTVFGLDVLKRSCQVRQMIGLVPQEIALYTEMSGRENMNFFGRLYGLAGSDLSRRVQHCLDFVGLTEKADQSVHTYSGGMKRRANLAAGILHSPKLLFLDEPTVGIDAQSRNMILERLKELSNQGVTMLYTTHYLEEAEGFCTRLAVIDHGRIIGEGQPAELIKAGNAQNLQELFFELTGREMRD